MGVTEIKHGGQNFTIEYDADTTNPKHPIRVLITCPVGGKLIVFNRTEFDAVGNYYRYIGQCQGCNTINILPLGILNETRNSSPDLTPKLIVTTFLTTQKDFCNNPEDEDLQLA